jgi:hypothetical protein
MTSKRTELAAQIRASTMGDPPDRACLGGSDEKWEGYRLGIEEAIEAALCILGERAEPEECP